MKVHFTWTAPPAAVCFLIQNKMCPKDVSTCPKVTKGLEVRLKNREWMSMIVMVMTEHKA